MGKYLGGREGLLKEYTKCILNKTNRLNVLKIRTSVHSKTSLREWKGKPQTEKIFEIYISDKLYTEYIKNFYQSIQKSSRKMSKD